MNHRLALPIALPLLAVLAAACGPGSASPRPTATSGATIYAPEVVQKFSALNPKPGQRVTLNVTLLNQEIKGGKVEGTKGISGATLTARIWVGAKVVEQVKGPKTNAKGQTSTTFTVPTQAAGKTMRVTVNLQANGQSYPGENVMQVAG